MRWENKLFLKRATILSPADPNNHDWSTVQMDPTTTMSMISSIVLWSALKALDFCSGVPKSPETISTIFPPYLGTNTLDVDEINTATVPRIKLTASGFA